MIIWNQKVILKICKMSNNSEIKTLKASELDSKMNRDMSDNLLVKTQALTTMLEAKIPKQYALPIVNLFSDANAVKKAMEEQEEEDAKKVEQQSNINQKIDAQNNKVQNVNQLDLQEQ